MFCWSLRNNNKNGHLAKKRKKGKEGKKKGRKENEEKEGKEKKEMEKGKYGNRMEERDILPTQSTLNLVKCLRHLQAGMTKRKTTNNYLPLVEWMKLLSSIVSHSI